jgi:hypothetical protein
MPIMVKGQQRAGISEITNEEWKAFTDEEFQSVLAQITSPMQRTIASSKRGVKAKTHAVADPYAHFRPDLALFPEPVKKFGFEWWANHFYQEVKDSEKKPFYTEVWESNQSLKKKFDTQNASADRAVWRDLLERVLEKGFIEYPAEVKGDHDQWFPPIKDDPHLRLGYRGELRQPMQVKAHNGCVPKAQVLGLRIQMNMNANWHPFSDPAIRNKVYYRKGNGDNCLYSTVSVAYDFGTASKFPLLFDLKKDAPDAIGNATVEACGMQSKVGAMAAMLGPQITKQHFDPNFRVQSTKPAYAPGQMPAKPAVGMAPKPDTEYQVRNLTSVRMNVYLFRIRGSVWNTETYQAANKNAQFPERAMDKVPWDDFLARVMIDRVHFGDDSNDGHLNIVHGYELLHPMSKLRLMLGGGVAGNDALTRLVLYLREICAANRLSGEQCGHITPFTTANTDPKIKIRRIIRIDARTDWGINPAKNQS